MLLSTSSIQIYFELLKMGNMFYTYLYYSNGQTLLGKVVLKDWSVLVKIKVSFKAFSRKVFHKRTDL